MSKLSMARSSVGLQYQQGHTLALSLIMLLLVSMVATSAVHSAKSENKMAASFADKQLAIQIARSGLIQAENWVYKQDFVASRDFSQNCQNQELCFNKECEHGLCATGYLNSADTCELKDSDPWANNQDLSLHYLQDNQLNLLDVWADEQRHKVVKIQYQSKWYQVKYIVEFFCFTARYSALAKPKAWPQQQQAWSPVFRVTVLAGGDSPYTSAMLQSLIKHK